MDEEKKKEGVSVKEIEEYAKKHCYEVVFVLALVLACFFSFVFFGTGLGIIVAAVGGIVGVLLPNKTELFSNKTFAFIQKQEQVTQIILGVVLLVISVFLPFITFLILGLYGGSKLRRHSTD